MSRAALPSRLPDARRIAQALLAALGLLVMLAVFVQVADLLADRQAGLIDNTALKEAVEHRSGPATWLMEAVSTAAEIPLMVAAAVLAAVVGWRERGWRAPVVTGAAGALAVGLATLVKTVAGRARPPMATRLVQETGFSFPSRHTTVATALLLVMAYLVASLLRSRLATLLVWVAAVGLAALVASSRVYLGVHWATDVTAGFALGAGAALTVVIADLVRRMWAGSAASRRRGEAG
ncbi:phosphatase PAP2 family protein [Streptomyces sp. NPDC059169]|uniref:phosphatase PAP2 family protein n=1 Tax=Streptomyces sp. NPDC059169 TaxID=3346754 RepID=UPI0036ACE20D